MAYNKRILSEIDRELKDRYRSKRYSKSLAATNSLFAVNDLFAKPSRRRIYNPNAQYFQDGGSHDPPEKSKSLDEVTVTGSRKDPPLSYAQKLAAYNDSLAAYNSAKDNYYYNPKTMGEWDYDFLVNNALKYHDPKSKTNYGTWMDTDNDDKIDKYIKGLTFEEYADKWRDSEDAAELFAMTEKFNVKPFMIDTSDGFPLEPLYVKPTYPTKPTMKEAYKNVDKEKYPTFEDFEYAAEFYKEYGKNPDPSDLPSNRLPAPPPPEYEVEDIEPEIEIEKLDVIQPEFLSNDAELPELEERDEVEGVDYKIKRGPFIQPGLGGNPFGRFGSNYYRGPRLKWGSHRVPIEEEQLYPDEFIANMKFQGGGALKAIAKNSKKILTKKDLDVIKSAAKDFKKYAIRSTDITVPAIKKAQRRLLEATDPKSRTIMTGVELTPDGKSLRVTADRVGGSKSKTINILRRNDEEGINLIARNIEEEAGLLKANAESYLENPYDIEIDRGNNLQFDKDGFLIEPLGGFYHGIGSADKEGFNLETLEFDRSKLDPDLLKGWTSTGNKYGSSKAEYGFFGALNKNQSSQAALKYASPREEAVKAMLNDPSIIPNNLGTIKEIGLSPNARLVGKSSPYVMNALKELGINVLDNTLGIHIGGVLGMTPQKAAVLRSKYGIDGMIGLDNSEVVIFDPNLITGVSDTPFKLFDYTNPILQGLKQVKYSSNEMENTLQNKFGSSYIHPERNQAYVPDSQSWTVNGADKLDSMMDWDNAYEARRLIEGSSSHFSAGLRMPGYDSNFAHGLPFSKKWWKAAEPNLDLIRQKGGPINTSGPRAEEAPVDEDAMNAMMKARLAYEYEKGNPAAKRMVAPVDNPYDFGDGRTGTHYMSSYDNYAIPEIQDVDGTLEMTGPRDNEAIRFDREEDARYFANENYKRVSPMFINAELDDKEIQKYVDGGYIVEEMAEGGDVDVKCPPGKAWNGKYCAKIQIVTEDGKKIKVVPSAYEMDNPTDPEYVPYGIELQRLSDIDKLYEYQDEYGWDDEMTNKKICGDAGCHSVLIDDDTEIENIEPVKKRRPIEDIYPEVDHDKYPTIEDFIFASDYYKENGEDPSDDLLPSNRVEEEPEVEEELDIEPLPVIEPDPIINDIPEPIIDNRVIEDEIVEEEDIEDELPSAEEFYADSLPVTNSEGEIVLPYEETTGKYRKERRGTRRPRTKNRSWDGVRGNLQRIFTDKEYSGPWFPGLKRRIKQEGGVPKFSHGGPHDPIPVTDPADPRLHMYLDSLNLYKGYLKEKELFPEAPLKGMKSTRHSKTAANAPVSYYADARDTHVYNNWDEYSKDDEVFQKLMDKYRKSDDISIDWNALESDPKYKSIASRYNTPYPTSFRNAEDLTKYSMQAGDRQNPGDGGALMRYYDNLSFRYPTKVGSWHSPDLGHSKIQPLDSYLGEAWNPIYARPVQPYYYTGSKEDVEKLRGKAGIYGIRDFKSKSTGTSDPKKSVNVNLIKLGLATDTKSANVVKKELYAELFPDEEYKGKSDQNIKLNEYIFDNNLAKEDIEEIINPSILPPPAPPQYEIEPVAVEPEISPLPVMPAVLPSDLGDIEIVGDTAEELEEREEVEGVDYERKFGMWLEDKAQKDAKLKTFFKYKLPEFFNPKKSRWSQYYRTPKRIRAGFYNKPIEDEQLYPEGFVPKFYNQGGSLELGDEVTEDMVEELRRQGYTIEEI